jgi:hypothetical protein
VLIFSIASAVAEFAILLNKSFKTYVVPILPPGSSNWQLIYPNCIFSGALQSGKTSPGTSAIKLFIFVTDATDK